MHLLNKNLPMKECLKYLGNFGNFLAIKISIILHIHLTVYGIISDFDIKFWIKDCT